MSLPKGKVLVQAGTNRVYMYTDELAGRDDMMMFVDGKQVQNRKLGQNTVLSEPPSDEQAEAMAKQNIEMQSKLNSLEEDNKKLMEELQRLRAGSELQQDDLLSI